MPNEILLLYRLLMRNFGGLNVFLNTNDKKIKRRYGLLFGVVGFVVLVAVFYVIVLSYGLIYLGLHEILLPYLNVISSIIILFFGIFKSGSEMYSKKRNDVLFAIPIRRSSILISRFLKLYTEDLLMTLLVMLPGSVMYAVFAKPGVIFYLMLLPVTLALPIIPLSISVLFGTAVYAISSRMKRRSLAEALISVVIVVTVLVLSMSAGKLEELTPEYLSELLASVGDKINSIYPPALWAHRSYFGDINYILLYLGVSFGIAALTFAFSSFVKVSGSEVGFVSYTEKSIKSSGIVSSLVKREFRRYFASSVYVTNTIIGPIMGLLLSVAVLVVGVEKIRESIPLPIDIVTLIPFAFSAVFTMMNTTSVSLSMEGKNMWILKSLPISSKSITDVKILMNLLLDLPFYVLSEILLIIALKPSPMQLLSLIFIPASVIVVSTVFGLFFNLKMHSFDWENETHVVKQSAPAAFGGFFGFFVSLLTAFPCFLFEGGFLVTVGSAVSAILLLIAYVIRKSFEKMNIEEL